MMQSRILRAKTWLASKKFEAAESVYLTVKCGDPVDVFVMTPEELNEFEETRKLSPMLAWTGRTDPVQAEFSPSYDFHILIQNPTDHPIFVFYEVK